MAYQSKIWGGQHTWNPQQVVTPASLEELREVILASKAKGTQIRAAGSLHSLNTLCATDGTQLLTDKLNRVLTLDKERQRVKAEGGIKIKDLLHYLAKEGLTLPNQGYIFEQSIAGATATATHGSGKTGTLSSFIEEIELIDANGQLHHLTPETNKHLFSAAVVGLGCLGIIYSMTLRCVPLIRLELSKVRGEIHTTLQELPELCEHYDFFQIVVDPYSNNLFSWRYTKTEAPYRRRFLYALKWYLIKALAVTTFDILRPPAWSIPCLLKFYMAMSPFASVVDDSYRLLSPADEGHYIETEIAIPYEHLNSALATTREIINRYSNQGTRVVAIILIRFAEPDTYGYLSPTLGRKTAYISLITIAKQGYKELFKDVENALYEFEGRPHWGKAHHLTRDIVEKLYPATYRRFVEARRELDPDSLFSNAYIDTLFTYP